VVDIAEFEHEEKTSRDIVKQGFEGVTCVGDDWSETSPVLSLGKPIGVSVEGRVRGEPT
jgi:hypothetical protein